MRFTLASATALVLAGLMTLGATSVAQAGTTASILTGGATGCCRQLIQ